MEKGTVLPLPSPHIATETAAEKTRRKQAQSASINWMQGELLGSGSCGQVYLGLNIDTGRLMAVKQVEHLRGTSGNMNGVRALVQCAATTVSR